MDNLQLENYPKSISIFKWKLQTRTLTIVFAVALLCVNIFFLLQNIDDPVEEHHENIDKIVQNFKVFDNLDNSFRKDSVNMNDAFRNGFTNAAKNLIPADAIKRLRIGRVIVLIRSSINILAIISLIYGAVRYNSVYVLIGFIYWCAQSAIGWPLVYYFTGEFWDAKMIWEVVISIKLEICLLVVAWGCYKYVESQKTNTASVNSNP